MTPSFPIEEGAPDEQIAVLDKLSADIEAFSRSREHWSKKKLKEAGALVSLTSAGTLQVTRASYVQSPIKRRDKQRLSLHLNKGRGQTILMPCYANCRRTGLRDFRRQSLASPSLRFPH